eukprot:1530549-Pyramimonas_sp.AAC.1
MVPKWMSSGSRLSSAPSLAVHSARPSSVAGHCHARCRTVPCAGHPLGHREDDASGLSSANLLATGHKQPTSAFLAELISLAA